MARENPETGIMRTIRRELCLSGWFVIRMQQGLGCYPGVSDLVCVKDGRVVWLEVKTPKGRQSDDQRAFERDITANGGEYRVARGFSDVGDMVSQMMFA